MKTVFIKYNKERLPCFQIITKIIEEDGISKAIKQPISALAKNHIQAIYNNHELLMARYPFIFLCKPTLVGDNIAFEFVQGETFERLLKQELDKQNKVGFLNLIERYIKYIDGFVSKRNIEFIPGEHFKEIFGKWGRNQPEDIISIANVDLNFSNIFEYENKITIIDYEWVFDFPIPKIFIIWRAINIFFIIYGKQYSKLICLDEVLNKIGISMDYCEIFLQMEHTFQKYVHGPKFNFFLNRNCLLPKIDLSQELSLVKHNLAEINQELTQSHQEIERLTKNLVESSQQADNLSKSLENSNHLIIDLTQSQAALSQKVEELSKSLVESNNRLEQSQQTCEVINQNLEHSNQKVEELGKHLVESNQKLEQATHTCEILNQNLLKSNKELGYSNQACQDLGQKLEKSNQKILAMENSKSWKITAPLRKLVRMLPIK